MTGGPRPRGRTAMAVVATTAEVLAHPELHEGLLASWELRRLARTRLPGRRDDVLAARLLLRLCVARYTARPLREAAPAQYCADCGGSGHGRPYLPAHPGVGVSLSHTDGLVAAAVGPGAVGVDVEPAARRPGPLSVLKPAAPRGRDPGSDRPAGSRRGAAAALGAQGGFAESRSGRRPAAGVDGPAAGGRGDGGQRRPGHDLHRRPPELAVRTLRPSARVPFRRWDLTHLPGMPKAPGPPEGRPGP